MPRYYNHEYYSRQPGWSKLASALALILAICGGLGLAFGHRSLSGLAGSVLLLGLAIGCVSVVITGLTLGCLPGQAQVSRRNEPVRFQLTMLVFGLFAALLVVACIASFLSL